MRISPIKSIIKNLTDQKFTTPVSSSLRIVINAKGTPGDTATVVGDVFTLMDRTAVVEALASAILDGKVSLEYIVDGIAEVTKNTNEPNINSSVAIQKRVADYNKKSENTVKAEKTEPVDTPLDNKPTEAPKQPEAPAKEVTAAKPKKARQIKVN